MITTHQLRGTVTITLDSGHASSISATDALALADSLRIKAYNASGLPCPAWEIELRELRERGKRLDRKLRARSIKLGRARRSTDALFEIAASAHAFGPLSSDRIDSILASHGNPHLGDLK